jgi:hypothetical protein
MKPLLFTLLTLALLTACTFSRENTPVAPPDAVVTSPPGGLMPPSSTDQNPYAPQPGDSALLRGNVYLDSAQILSLESYPLQIVLELRGNLPDPCHQLRVAVNPPDSGNRITIEVYSVADAGSICIQVLKPFDASIPLGSFPAGHYAVWVNGNQIGEFDA